MRLLCRTISSTLGVNGGSILTGFGPAGDSCECASGKYDPVTELCGESSHMGISKIGSNVVVRRM